MSRLADFANPRHEIAVFQQLRAVADEVERVDKAPHQHQTDGKGNDEDELGGKQPETVRGDEPGGKSREQQVQDDEINEEPCPEAHTGDLVLLQAAVEGGPAQSERLRHPGDVAPVMLHRLENHPLFNLVDRHAAHRRQHVALGHGRLHVHGLPEGGGIKDVGLAHQHGPLDRLTELADVAGPRLRHQP